MQYGPAHITLADYNLRNSNIQFCIDATEKSINMTDAVLLEQYHFLMADDLIDFREQLQQTKAFLEALLEIPEGVRLKDVGHSETVIIDYHPDNTPEENTAIFPDQNLAVTVSRTGIRYFRVPQKP